jgi:hypothetical protein
VNWAFSVIFVQAYGKNPFCRRSSENSRQKSSALFAWLISHQPAVLFSHNKPATSNQPAVLFSQNKPALAISHQPTEQAADSRQRNILP